MGHGCEFSEIQRVNTCVWLSHFVARRREMRCDLLIHRMNVFDLVLLWIIGHIGSSHGRRHSEHTKAKARGLYLRSLL